MPKPKKGRWVRDKYGWTYRDPSGRFAKAPRGAKRPTRGRVKFSKEQKESFDRAARAIAEAAAVLDATLGDGLVIIGEEIMADIKSPEAGRGVPKDKGHLLGSGRVVPKARTNKAGFGGKKFAKAGAAGVVKEVWLTFGGVAAPYALVQHERTDYHHDVGEARYLVRGVERWVPNGSAAWAAVQANARAGLRAVAARNAGKGRDRSAAARKGWQTRRANTTSLGSMKA